MLRTGYIGTDTLNPFYPRPTLVVAAGLPGSGKTRYCLQRFLDRPEDVVLVLPGRGHVESAKSLLRGAPEFGETHEFHLDSVQDWSRFIGTVVDLSRGKPFLPASRSTRLAVAATVAGEARSGYFGNVVETLGFQERLADIIEELTSSGLTPGELREAGERGEVTDKRFPEKCHALAGLWERYDALLAEMGMRGPAAAAVAACDVILRAGGLSFPEVWLDGFGLLSQVQVELLCALAERSRVGITLTWVPGSEELFAGASALLRRLEDRFEVVRVDIEADPDVRRSRTMQTLRDTLFLERSEVEGWDEEVLFVSCPNRLAEVEAAARFTLRLLREKPLGLSDIQVVVRDMEAYWPMLEAVWPRFGLTPSRAVERPIANNPFVRFLFSVLTLFARGWQREDVLSHLESSYAFRREDGRRLRRALGGLRGAGVSTWLLRAKELQDEGVECAGQLVELAEWSRRFEGAASPADFAALTRNLATEMGWVGLAAEADDARANEDFLATAAAYRVAEALGVVSKVRGDDRTRLSRFLPKWIGMCRLIPYRVPTKPGIRVLEGPEENTHPPRVGLLLGVLEGVFPRRLSEDAFLTDEERLELRRITGCQLPTGYERAMDERRRFYLAATQPTETLYVFFPRAEEESEALPSLYLDEVRSCFPAGAVRDVLVACGKPLETDGESQLAPSSELCFLEEDKLLRAAACFDRLSMTDKFGPGFGPDGRSMTDPNATSSSDAPFDEWSILPRFPRIQLTEAAMLAGRRPGPIPITELETLNRCAFQHWARYRAGLRGAAGALSRADTGSFLHEILRDAMRGANDADLLDRLTSELQNRLETIRLDVPDWEVHALHAMALRLLTSLAEREVAYRQAVTARPEFLEWRFGEPEIDETANRQRDPRSTSKPLRVHAADGRHVDLAGSVDRIDVDPDGRSMLILDYKLGSDATRRMQRIENAESLQLPLYALAARELLGARAVSMGFDALGGGERMVQTSPSQRDVWRPEVKAPGYAHRSWPESQWEKTLLTVREKVLKLVARLEQAYVKPTPSSDHCPTCPFGDLCRTTEGRFHDGEPYPEEASD
ncbi:MAG: exodeoxyribonuclease V subunit gamma [Fimbriimonadia bacterium]